MTYNVSSSLCNLQDSVQLFAVDPLSFCPHLTMVQPVPRSGLNSHAECRQCGAIGENWVCLTCYEVTVLCSRLYFAFCEAAG